MNSTELLKRLESLGSEQTRRILQNHGAQEPLFGVKVEELQKIRKQIKKDYELSLELFDTGNYDAQYLAGLIADETKMTRTNLNRWISRSNCMAISGTVTAWVAAESKHGRALAIKWIEAKDENKAQTGWATLSSWLSITADEFIDEEEMKQLLQRVEKTIHQQPNRVRSAMNGFVISLGAYVPELTRAAFAAGKRIGPVSVDVGKTACKVPYAPDYIQKIEQRGTLGKKRKTARC